MYEDITTETFGETVSIVMRRNKMLLPFEDTINRDNLGRIKNKVETVLGTGGTESRTVEYGYDLPGRLEDVSENEVAIRHYNYNGNRLSVSDPGVPGNGVGGTYDAQDRLIAYGANTYEYSANGTLSKKTTPLGVTTYDYDSLGNLRGVTLPNADVITYTLDGADRRVAKSVNGMRKKGFVYRNGLQIVAELKRHRGGGGYDDGRVSGADGLRRVRPSARRLRCRRGAVRVCGRAL